MSTHLPGFQSFFMFLPHFVLVKLATSSIRVTLVFPKRNFNHKCLMPDCYGDYWPKTGTMLFMFDDFIKFWSTIVICHIKMNLKSSTIF